MSQSPFLATKKDGLIPQNDSSSSPHIHCRHIHTQSTMRDGKMSCLVLFATNFTLQRAHCNGGTFLHASALLRFRAKAEKLPTKTFAICPRSSRLPLLLSLCHMLPRHLKSALYMHAHKHKHKWASPLLEPLSSSGPTSVCRTVASACDFASLP